MRSDLKVIAGFIAPGSRVLDIGCGEGALLEYLVREKRSDGRGLEIESARVSSCMAKGLLAVQGDADRDLAQYGEKAFDYVILAQTLQVMRRPKEVLEQSLRIGKRVIVSIPNFGHIANRLYLLTKGRMPVTSRLSYQWYETPNIHFSTIHDFVVLAQELGCVIEKRYCLYGERSLSFLGTGSFTANLFGDVGVFLLRKP